MRSLETCGAILRLKATMMIIDQRNVDEYWWSIRLIAKETCFLMKILLPFRWLLKSFTFKIAAQKFYFPDCCSKLSLFRWLLKTAGRENWVKSTSLLKGFKLPEEPRT